MPKINFSPDNFNVFMRSNAAPLEKEMLSEFAKNPGVKRLLDKRPLEDLHEISGLYMGNPELYDDVFSGKVKFFLDRVQMESLPIYDKDKKTNSIKKLLLRKSLVGRIIRLLQLAPRSTKKLSIEQRGKYLHADIFDSKDKKIKEFERLYEDETGILTKMIKASDDEKVEIIWD